MRKIADPFLVRDRRAYPWTVDLWLYWDERKKKYSKKPKSLHEYFENEYKEDKKYIEWKEWKEEHLTPYQDILIDRYIREEFWLIAIVPRSKAALEPWTIEENKLERRAAMRWMLSGGNIAVVCGQRSKGLICIDIDKETVPRIFKKFIRNTLTTKTQRGLHLYFRTEELPKKFGDILHDKYEVDCRYETQFALLPLSVHPSSTKKNVVFYDFVDYRAPILQLEELEGLVY